MVFKGGRDGDETKKLCANDHNISLAILAIQAQNNE